ncbi:MAG: hypothetical protein CM15mL4_2910 [uncultured marine virus]|nr:MAG: hypothetical protein CM15mL4_2910 [uncultured marine virus]
MVEIISIGVLKYEDMFRKEILHDDMLFTKIGWVYHFNAYQTMWILN